MRAFVVLAVLCFATACGGKSSSSLGSVTKNDLAIMVLPAAELGEVAEGLPVEPDSGFQDTADVAEDTIDPDDTATDVEESGLQADYQLSYGIAAERQVNTEVALFGTAEEAEAFVEATVGNAETYEGQEAAGGAVTLTSIDVAEADGPGDTAWEGSATATVGETEISSTVVAFTIDNVAASVSVTVPGAPLPTEDVQPLAEKLATRIEAVAGGEISDTPVPVPTETTSTTADEDPALERMVLSLDDLPEGVAIEKDGYVTDGGDVSFEREFAVGNATIGRSELIGLSSNAERLSSAAESALAVKAVPGIIKGAGGKKLFADSFSAGSGFDATNLEVEEIPVEGVGDAVSVLHATFDTRAGPFEAVFVFIAEGRAAGQIYAAGAKGKVFPEDIVALARTMATKMEAEES